MRILWISELKSLFQKVTVCDRAENTARSLDMKAGPYSNSTFATNLTLTLSKVRDGSLRGRMVESNYLPLFRN